MYLVILKLVFWVVLIWVKCVLICCCIVVNNCNCVLICCCWVVNIFVSLDSLWVVKKLVIVVNGKLSVCKYLMVFNCLN